MFGLSSTDWAAIATGVLAAVTIVYVALVGRTAYHARRSAEAAERAAEAAHEAAAVARATSDPGFEVEMYPLTDSEAWVRVESTGATVWVHDVRLNWLLELGKGMTARDRECPLPDDQPAPALVHKGNALVCGWPARIPEDLENAWASVRVDYSFTPDGDHVTVARPCEFRKR